MKSIYSRALIVWIGSTLFVWLAVALAPHFIVQGGCTGHHFGYFEWFSKWDGQWYAYIAEHGYDYSDPGGYSPTVFFPLYPLLGRLIHFASGMPIEWALQSVTILSGLCLALGLGRYLQLKLPDNHGVSFTALAVFCFGPAAYFLHINYTEVLFVALLAVFFCCLLQRVSLLWLVCLCGLLSATRPTAIVCAAVLAIHVFHKRSEGPVWKRIMKAGFYGVLGLWGLLLYALFLASSYGDAWMFTGTQQAWRGVQINTMQLHWLEIITFKPVWSSLPTDITNPVTYPYNVLNRLPWILAWPALMISVMKRWLTLEEFAFCAIMLLLVYAANGYPAMGSVGRYCLALLPVFYVYSRLLNLVSRELQTVIIVFLAVCLFLNTGLFSQMHCMY